ncbi:MAG: hypothetical protein RLZZ210_1852 [Pseudomonadota bacterium]|jgi:aminoglycoside/choline kinase family phosphotransferase
MTTIQLGQLERNQELKNWLEKINNPEYALDISTLQVASSDASFRSYFRIHSQNKSYIVMDAPPQHEDCTPFVNITKIFESSINVPHIFEQNLAQGFLLLTDFGDTTLFKSIKQNNDIISTTEYIDICNILIDLQLDSKPNIIPNYDEAKLKQEIYLFNDWYAPKHCNKPLNDEQKNNLESIYQKIVKNNLAQAQVYVHRDYHSRNIMKTNDNKFGIIDFQDALYGAITYDLVSLLKDAYIELNSQQHDEILAKYWENAKAKGLNVKSFEEFTTDYELMGLQRHLKVLGIFARLYHRDGKSSYLNDILWYLSILLLWQINTRNLSI